MTHSMKLRKRTASSTPTSSKGTARKNTVVRKNGYYAPDPARKVTQKKPQQTRGRSATKKGGDEMAAYVKSPVSGAWILLDGPAYSKLTATQRKKADATLQSRPRRSKSRSRSRSRSQSVSAVKAREALKQKPITREQVEDVLSQKTARVEDLEETLQRTTQPYLRRKLQAQIKAQRAGTARYSPTRGWAARAPQTGKPRERLYSACGSDAFLLPDKQQPGKSKFPIVAKCGTGTEGACDCEIDCGGVQSAYNRARQHKYENVAAAAQDVLSAKCRY